MHGLASRTGLSASPGAAAAKLPSKRCLSQDADKPDRPQAEATAPASSQAWSPQHKAHFSGLGCRELVSWLGHSWASFLTTGPPCQPQVGLWGGFFPLQEAEEGFRLASAMEPPHALTGFMLDSCTQRASRWEGRQGCWAPSTRPWEWTWRRGSRCCYMCIQARPGSAPSPLPHDDARLAGPLGALATGSACCWGAGRGPSEEPVHPAPGLGPRRWLSPLTPMCQDCPPASSAWLSAVCGLEPGL